MRVVYAVIALLLIPSLSWAGNMTFQFRNPNFGGNPNNGSFLLNSAQAQNSYKDPSADDDFGIETPSALDNFTQAIQAQATASTNNAMRCVRGPGRAVQKMRASPHASASKCAGQTASLYRAMSR